VGTYCQAGLSRKKISYFPLIGDAAIPATLRLYRLPGIAIVKGKK